MRKNMNLFCLVFFVLVHVYSMIATVQCVSHNSHTDSVPEGGNTDENNVVNNQYSYEDIEKKMIKQRLSSSKSNSIFMSLSDSNYADFVLTFSPRSYHLVLFYTAADPRYKCDKCHTFSPEFELVAETYVKNRDRAILDNLAEKEDKEVKSVTIPTVFATVDYSRNSKTFRRHGFTQIPHLVVLPNTVVFNKEQVEASASASNTPFEFDESLFFPFRRLTEGDDVAQHLVTFLQNKVTDDVVLESVTIHRPVKLTDVVQMLVFCIALLLALYQSLVHLQYVLTLVRNTKIWMIVSLCVYMTSISGMIFCVIRNPAPYGIGKNGKIQYFQNGRSQFVYEGLIIGSLHCAAAFSIIQMFCLTEKPRKSDSFLLVKLISCCIVFYWAYCQIQSAYVQKNPHYSHMTQKIPFF